MSSNLLRKQNVLHHMGVRQEKEGLIQSHGSKALANGWDNLVKHTQAQKQNKLVREQLRQQKTAPSHASSSAQTIFRMMIGGKYLKAFGQCLVKKSNILSILQRRGFLKGDVVRTKVKILESHIPIITISFLMMFAIVYVKNSTCLHWISAADGFLISTKIKTQKLVYLPNRNGANMQRRSCPHLQAIRTRSHQFHTKAWISLL